MSKASKTAQGILGQSPARANIGRRNFIKDDLDLDDDDDGGTESYSIEPGVPLWKAIDFKSKTKQTPNSMDPTQVGAGQHSSKHNLLSSSSTTSISGKLRSSFKGGVEGSSYTPGAAPSFTSSGSQVMSPVRHLGGSPASPGAAAVTRLLSRESSRNGGSLRPNLSIGGSAFPSSSGSGGSTPLAVTLSPVRQEEYVRLLGKSGDLHSPAGPEVGGDFDRLSLTGAKTVLLGGGGKEKAPAGSSSASCAAATPGSSMVTPLTGAAGPVRRTDFAGSGPGDDDGVAATNAPLSNKVSLTGAESVLLSGSASPAGASAAERAALERQQAEEAHRRELAEKEALAQTLAAAADVGRQADADRVAELARRERDELRAQLEVMEMQNKLMLSRMERNKEEARQELEREREERKKVLAGLELENQKLSEQLIRTEQKAEADLMKEKVQLRVVLMKMEQEKQALLDQMHATEEKAVHEQALLQMQRDEFRQNLLKMEAEHKGLELELREREVEQQSASAELSAKIELQKAELLSRVQALEGEKSTLTADLAINEQTAREQQFSIESQLAAEREALRSSMARMEAEKAELSAHLVETERKAHETVMQASLHLTAEKQGLEESMRQIQAEKEELASMLKRKESQLSLASAQAAEQLTKERDQVAALMESITRQKEELAAQLAQVEASQQVRVEAQAQQAAAERDELRAMVQRMKEELAAERTRAQEQLAAAMQARQMGNLTPSKSLFDLMAGGDGGGMRRTASRTVNQPLPHDISAIKEGEEEPNFMEYDEDEDGHLAERDKFTNLPAPHAAAASGDLQRLQMLSGVELSLLCSYDSAHRSPLFYSVAYDNLEVVKFLLEKFPEMAGEADEHGDTPLHAAVSADSVECVELLLKAMAGKGSEDYSQPANHMLMTPVHLTASVECLDLLYQNGASLTAVDNHGRSPLFVACAMNRWACAEYLIEGLDQEIGSLYIQDDRGDTPLHAAACNGAVDCVLLMLQYGVDPTVANTKGLKAIDLAIRNKHKKCQQLLAEYHLHYCTSSDFDSVLFLATLEGHKQAKDTYEIVKRQQRADDPLASASSGNLLGLGSAPKGLKDTKSYFSLKKNKTMRLQRWGAWIAYEDPETKQNYWYNQSTSSGQWEVPPEVAAMQAQMKVAPKAPALPSGVSASFANLDDLKTLKHAKQSMRLKKIGDWIHYITEGGQPFYYNEKNGEFQWESPFGPGGSGSGAGLKARVSSAALHAKPAVGVTPDRDKDQGKGKDSDSPLKDPSAAETETAGEEAAAAADAGGEESQDSEWRPYKDPDSGALFWYNSTTGVSQWECPYDHPLGEDGGGGNEGEGDDGEHHDAEVCHDTDDLGI